VYISGSLVSGSTNTSYALYSTGTNNSRKLKNNIFVNARSTASGSSKHYAMYLDASGGTLTCNYNNYYVSGTGGVLGYLGADVTSLPIVTSQDANSIATNPTFSSAGGTNASNYIPTVRGVADNSTGVNVDYAGNTRGTNVTMGAFENATTLPVNITQLQASKQQLGINLVWKAENELSIENYIVERSSNGINFEAIGSINAVGNNGATVDYHFFDALPLNGNNYYRIKANDKSGAFRFTNIVVINLKSLLTGISVYPNPISTGSFMLKLQGMAAGQYGIQLFTNQGQQVLVKEIKHLGGSSTVTINLPSGLSAGMYFIRYTKNNVVLKNEQVIIEL
jgi:hypothetical protein